MARQPSLVVTLNGNEAAGDQLTKFAAIDFGVNEDAADARNGHRSVRASKAIRAYAGNAAELSEPLEQIVRDLLTDLMHLTDRLRNEDGEGFAFDDLVERAHRAYRAEVAGE